MGGNLGVKTTLLDEAREDLDWSLVPTFSEFLVPVVFTSFKPFLLREKRVSPTLVIIMRLGFQSPRKISSNNERRNTFTLN